MPGERLYEYTVDLVDYILGQVRPHLRELQIRPASASSLPLAEWERLTLPAWLGRGVAGLPLPLADHVWVGVRGEPLLLPLNDRELNLLEVMVEEPPPLLERHCMWSPYPGLHRRAVDCVREVRSELTRVAAEEWAEESAKYAARLDTDGLPLAGGVATIREWLWSAWRLLGAMGATEYLPTPAGTHPTPTRPSLTPMPARAGRRARQAVPAPDAEGSGGHTPEMLSPARITRRFDVSRSTVYTACRSGLLPHYRVPARKGARGKYLIKEADLQAWLEALKSPGTPPPAVSAPASSGSPAEPFSELDAGRLARAWAGG